MTRLVTALDDPATISEVGGKGVNLVPNGDFETGDTSPKGWQQVDGLTTYYVKDADAKHGKVLKFDTDVLQSQGYEWWSKIAKG